MTQSWQYPLHKWGLVAAMSGIYTAYAWDRLIDARRDGIAVPLVRIIHLGVGGGLLTLAVFFHPPLLPMVLVLAGLGTFYIPLKQFIPKNLLTALAWTLVVVKLPLDVLPFSWKILLGATAVFLTIYGAAPCAISLMLLKTSARERED